MNQIKTMTMILAMGLSSWPSSTFSQVEVSWRNDDVFHGLSVHYNKYQHEYRRGYTQMNRHYGVLDGCDSSFDAMQQPQFAWQISIKRAITAIPNGPTSWQNYWHSQWVSACKLQFSGVADGKLLNGEIFGDLFLSPSAPTSEIPEQKNNQAITSFQQIGSTPNSQQVSAAVDALGVRAPLELSRANTLRDRGIGQPGDTIPTPPRPEPEPLLLGPSLETGDYQVTLYLRDGNSGAVQTEQLEFSTRYKTIALLGDSYISGEGNPDYHGQVKPLEVGIGAGLGKLAGLVGAPGIVQKGVAKFFEDAQIQVGDDDSICKFTRGAAFLLKDRVDLPYDAVHVLGSADRNGLEMLNEPDWLDLSANRSYQSGHAKAAKQIGFELNERTGGSVRVFNFATSGAKTENLLRVPQRFFQRNNELEVAKGQIAELENALGKQRIDVLLLSIGGNDVGFADFLTQAALGIVSDRDITIDSPTIGGNLRFEHKSDEPEFQKKLNSLKFQYRKISAELKARLNIGTVVLTGYPTDIFSDGNGGTSEGCGVFKEDILPLVSGVQRSEALIFKTWAERLKETQQQLADELGWIYVDVSDQFLGHGYCNGGEDVSLENCSSSGKSYFRSAERSCVIQGNLNGTMHPNPCGHQVYQQALMPVLRESILPRNTIVQPKFLRRLPREFEF